MLRVASLLACCVALFGATTVTGVADEQNRSLMPEGSYQEANLVCCRHGGQWSFMPFSQCVHDHGRTGNNAKCRHDANTSSDSRWQGSDENDGNSRVCCQKGRRDWWTTARECRAEGGNQSNARQCGNG